MQLMNTKTIFCKLCYQKGKERCQLAKMFDQALNDPDLESRQKQIESSIQTIGLHNRENCCLYIDELKTYVEATNTRTNLP